MRSRVLDAVLDLDGAMEEGDDHGQGGVNKKNRMWDSNGLGSGCSAVHSAMS